MAVVWYLVNSSNNNIEQCNDNLNRVIEELVRLQMVTSLTKIKVFEMFINFETPIFDDDKLFYCYMSIEKFLFKLFKNPSEIKISISHDSKLHSIEWQISNSYVPNVFGIRSGCVKIVD